MSLPTLKKKKQPNETPRKPPPVRRASTSPETNLQSRSHQAFPARIPPTDAARWGGGGRAAAPRCRLRSPGHCSSLQPGSGCGASAAAAPPLAALPWDAGCTAPLLGAHCCQALGSVSPPPPREAAGRKRAAKQQAGSGLREQPLDTQRRRRRGAVTPHGGP